MDSNAFSTGSWGFDGGLAAYLAAAVSQGDNVVAVGLSVDIPAVIVYQPAKPSSAVLRSYQPTRITVSPSLKRSTRTSDVQRWGLHLGWENLERERFSPLIALLVAQKGQVGELSMTVPGYTDPQGTWAGAPAVNLSGTSGNTVRIRGLTAGQPTAAKAGDVIRFAGHSKVYMITADAASDGSGVATLNICPGLKSPVRDGELITVRDVPFTLSLSGDSLEVDVNIGPVFSLQADFVESL